MIRKEKDRNIDIKTNFKDGPGEVNFKTIASSDELFNRIKMYSVLTFKKDCGIGYHCHENEEEVILVLNGKAKYNDGSNECELEVGDVAICEDGHGHSVTNMCNEELKIVAMVLYK